MITRPLNRAIASQLFKLIRSPKTPPDMRLRAEICLLQCVYRYFVSMELLNNLNNFQKLKIFYNSYSVLLQRQK